MTKDQISECLGMLVAAIGDLELAKDDYKLKETAAFETYEFSPLAIKAMRQIAKAKVKGNLEDVEALTTELADMIEVVRESGLIEE